MGRYSRLIRRAWWRWSWLGLLVQASVSFAKSMGVSDLVMPDHRRCRHHSRGGTSITAAIKGERDIAVGNVVRQETFNILG